MADGHGKRNVFLLVVEEFALALLILATHGGIAAAMIMIGAGLHWLLKRFGDPGHEPELAGVTVRYIIEGGEVALTAIVMAAGLISALIIFGTRLIKHLKG